MSLKRFNKACLILKHSNIYKNDPKIKFENVAKLDLISSYFSSFGPFSLAESRLSKSSMNPAMMDNKYQADTTSFMSLFKQLSTMIVFEFL